MRATAMVVGAVAALVVLLAGAYFWFVWLPDYSRSAAAEPKVNTAAAQFRPLPGWKPEREHRRGAAVGCVAVRCPGIQQVWDVGPGHVTREQLTSVLSAPGYSPAEDCRGTEKAYGGRMVVGPSSCHMKPSADLATDISVSVEPDSGSSSSADPPARFLTLNISRVYG